MVKGKARQVQEAPSPNQDALKEIHTIYIIIKMARVKAIIIKATREKQRVSIKLSADLKKKSPKQKASLYPKGIGMKYSK